MNLDLTNKPTTHVFDKFLKIWSARRISILCLFRQN